MAAAGRADLLATAVAERCTVLIAAPELMPALKPVLPDPGVPFQLVHHDDVATALVAAVLGQGAPGVYNLAGPGELTMSDLASALKTLVEEDGVNVVGGCCGTSAEHLRAVVEAIGDRAPQPRAPEHPPGTTRTLSPAVSGKSSSPAKNFLISSAALVVTFNSISGAATAAIYL